MGNLKGKFITFEGCEGVGKSRQIAFLKKYLEDNGIDYILAREPGGTPISESIREVILSKDNLAMSYECEALLYAAARAQLVREVILPQLERGKLVICDRYIDSSFAYQAYARGLGYDFVAKINEYAIKNAMPDATLFLDLDPDSAFKRKGGVDKNDRVELSGMQFHLKVYEGYVEIMKKDNGKRIIDVDCGGRKEETHQKIISALKDRGII